MSESAIAQAITAGGTAGLILALLVALVAFALGKVRRGSEVVEWQEVAKTALAASEQSVDASKAAAASVERLVPLVERLVAAFERQALEAEIRRTPEPPRRAAR